MPNIFRRGSLARATLLVAALVGSLPASANAVSGSVSGVSFNLQNVIVGDAGSEQFGILVSDAPTLTCELETGALSSGNWGFLELLTPSSKGVWRIKEPPRNIRETARAILHATLGNKREKLVGKGGWVRIEKISSSSAGSVTTVEGKLHVDFEGGSIEGSFTAAYCGPIGL